MNKFFHALLALVSLLFLITAAGLAFHLPETAIALALVSIGFIQGCQR